MFLLLLLAAAGGFVYYETVYKPSVAPPAPTPTPQPSSPTYVQYGLTFLNPTVADLVIFALGAVPGTSSTQTDSAGQPYYVTTMPSSLSLSDARMGTSFQQAIAAGAGVLLVGPLASWAAGGGSGAVPSGPSAMVTHLPSADPVLSQLQRLSALAGGGVVLGPQATALQGTAAAA